MHDYLYVPLEVVRAAELALANIALVSLLPSMDTFMAPGVTIAK